MEPAIHKIPGPVVNGKRTTLLLFQKPALDASPLLPSFQTMINVSFSAGHPPWIPSSVIRLASVDQFPRELGPNAFTYAIVEDHNDAETPEVLATISGRPFKWREPELQDPKYRTWAFWTNPEEPGFEVWELKLIVVHPKAQNHGLATMLTDLLESEVRRRFEAKKLADSEIASMGETDHPANRRRLKIVLQTLWEMNCKFYEKRGWILRDKTYRGPGVVMGSETGFHCAAYEKIFDF